MKTSKRRKIVSRITTRRKTALFLILLLLFQVIAPTTAFALTGGPSQPEVQSFEPIGTSDMVDPFTGDFNYNIPLLDIDGYPINIAYHSGITMDQEASWVGLGWNINPGVINRGMRGIPDDFNGDEVVKELSMKPNKTYGLNTGAGIEIFGLSDAVKIGIGYTLGVRYNNYNGVGIEQGLNLSLSAGDKGKSPLNGSLGITSSSDDGLSLNPSVGFSASLGNSDKTATQLGLSVGTAFNSRGGLKTLSVSANVSTSATLKKGSQKSKNNKEGREHNETGISEGQGASSTFDFGMPTYTPQGGPSMQNFSITGNFKLGFEVYGLNPHFTIGGYYSAQKLSQNVISNPAYGYMNADEGTKYDNALLDFNREKDGSFTPNTPALPLTNFTYDIYSVSGQGVGGSYRPFRGDLGHVFDPRTNTTSDGISTGFEIGVGNLTHFGFDLAVTDVNTKTGRWSNDNPAASHLTHRASTGDPLYEKYYFKEANEKSVDADSTFFKNVGRSAARSVLLNQLSQFHTIGDHYFAEGGSIPSDNYRKARERRNQSLSVITRGELDNFGLEKRPMLNKLGNAQIEAKAHHIAEITTLRADGARYVYGIAAYNKKQEEVTFAIGNTLSGSQGRSGTALAKSGSVTYQTGDNSTGGNALGLDNYFSNTIMPAYAHSYLLTAILSPDYVDSENTGPATKGPSDGDIGNYTKFKYNTKIEDYNWRVPLNKNEATFNEGLKSDLMDDKANYIYGEKELWYLDAIETKNYIAIFTLEDRKDGYGVVDNNGGRANTNPMKLLKKISLYVKREYNKDPANAVAIKTVHFEYDYSLCPNVPNNSGVVEMIDNKNINQAKGKLTLKKIYFSYQNSNKARLSPYEFFYAGYDKIAQAYDVNYNPPYNVKGYDRWGNFKPNTVTTLSATDPVLSTAEYPYVEQDQSTADIYTQAWSLTEIDLPSGGTIKVDYESDDYAYVQNKRAGQMFKVVDVTDVNATPTVHNPGFVKSLDNTKRLYFKTQNGFNDIAKYFAGIDKLYFRFLVDIKGGRYEYVSGYAEIEKYDYSGSNLGWVDLKEVKLKDNNPATTVNPIVKAAIQFGRLNMSRVVWNAADLDNKIGDNGSFGEDLLKAIINADFTKNISDAILGPNEALYHKYAVGRAAVMGKSWIRLNNPNMKKLGGGCRVKKISISDEWAGMTNNADPSFSYGQDYSYTLDDNTSSGVASYEPQLGGDENPWKQPVFFDESKLLAPDDEHYMEEPFGESFFPSPSVGYSRVTVKNLQHTNVTRHATGKVVHTFYTAKDFPTITERTNLDPQQDKTSPFDIRSLLKIDLKNYMTASQGYVIELNDMHGKPAKQEVYQESQSTPITSVEYHYKSKPYLNGSFRLDNQATVIYNNGSIGKNTDIGVFFDFVSDMREHSTTTISGSINGNVDGFLVAAYPVYVPVILPSFAREKTQFRSAVTTKVIQRFGILEETVAKDLGSVVSTRNLAYDAEAGNVLLTQTTTNFNDQVYSLSYPAHWYYDGMGPAYRNIGFSKTGVTFTSGVASIANAATYFAEGDELALSNGTIGWVAEVNPSSIKVIKRDGTTISATTLDVKVIRSGRRNQTGVPMATLTSLSNPLTNFKSNIYDHVLQAQAMEFTNGWRTFCDCFGGSASTTNPYILGTKGMYKNKKSYLHLAGRTQSNYNSNTNIRKDGVFLSYTPFYKLNAGHWEIDGQNWTYTSEVTEFSPFGAELENKDALGRFSAATYGYNQTFPTAVAANAKYKQVGFDNFEDYDFSICADNHFKFRNHESNVNETQSHTGRKSIKVSSGSAVNLTKQLQPCDSLNVCNLNLSPAFPTPTGGLCFTVSGGTAPYLFDWTSTGCDLNVTINDAGNSICVIRPTSSVACQLVITVTDKNKCKKIFLPINLSTSGSKK